MLFFFNFKKKMLQSIESLKIPLSVRNDDSDVVDEIEDAREEFIDELDTAMTELVAGVTGEVGQGEEKDFNISECRLWPSPRIK